MCLNRLQRLYKTSSVDKDTGTINVCDDIKNPPRTLIEEYGMKHFLNLYYFNLVKGNEKDEIESIDIEFSNLTNALSGLLENNVEIGEISFEKNTDESKANNTASSKEVETKLNNLSTKMNQISSNEFN